VMKAEYIDVVLKRFNFTQLDDLYSSIGSGALGSAQVVTRIKEEMRKNENESVQAQNWRTIERQQGIKRKTKTDTKKPGIEIKGEKDLLVRFAQCCNPVPGDEIVGFITKGRGASIHRKDCKNFEYLSSREPERVVSANWTGDHTADFLADVHIQSTDRHGLLSDITMVLAESKIALKAMNARTGENHIATISLTLKVSDINQLEKVMKDFRKIKGVIDVYRHKS
jgi:guanosine-3',5'-bis(diphosphate) 3'-pyrophosphohydrolase